MQTFLPYSDFAESAACLDVKRLNKQRSECKQILRALGVPIGEAVVTSSGWRNHPAVRMWRDREQALLLYAVTICFEWRNRGFEDVLLPQFQEHLKVAHPVVPSWLGDEEFHLSHKSNLVRKLPQHYANLWPLVPPNLPYIWPISK